MLGLTRRYTAEDLLQGAEAQGTPVSARLLTDWISLGLLDQPLRRGLGRGKGSTATWSANQRRLFLIVLEKRQEVKRVATLCNIPVAMWLYFGPDCASTALARRAITTFASNGRTASRRAAGDTARRVVDQLASPNMRRKDRTALIGAIIEASGGGKFNREKLLTTARKVFDPDATGRTLGPPGARMTADSWVRVVEANITAADSLPTLSDDQLEDARLSHHSMMHTYMTNQASFAQDPDIGSIFTKPSNEYLVNNACAHLLTTIGFLELARRSAGQETTSQPHTQATYGPH